MSLIALGVTGGIGAYKAVEVCRGLQKRGHDVVAVMTRSATRFVGPGDVRGDHPAAGDHVAVAAGNERGHRAHRHRRRHQPAARRAVHGQRHRQVRQRHRRRLPELPVSGDASARDAGAGDERQHAGARRRAAEPADARVARRAVRRARRGLPGLRLDWQGAARRARGDRRRGLCAAVAARLAASRSPRPRVGGADLRGHRSRPLSRESIERQDGIRAGRRGASARRPRDAGCRTHSRRAASR